MTTDTMPTEALSGAEARRAARNAGAIAAARILSSAVQFGWQLILSAGARRRRSSACTRRSGALFAIAATITAFSMSLIVIRDVARRPETAGRYLSATLLIETMLGLVAYVGINVAASGYDSDDPGVCRRRRAEPADRHGRAICATTNCWRRNGWSRPRWST